MIHAYQAEDLNIDTDNIIIKASDLNLRNYVPLFNNPEENGEGIRFTMRN